MIKKKVGTITLAVGLIAAGLILFAQNFTPLPVKDLYKYWPVLLIGLGLEMIVYMAIYGGREHNNVKVSLDGFCVFLIIFLAVLSNGVRIINLDNPFNFHFNNTINGINYTSEYKTDFTKENISAGYSVKNLNIRNDFGDIKVLKADGNSIRLEAKVRVKNNNDEKAKAYAKDAIEIKEGETTQISIKSPSDNDRNAYAKANVDFVVYVPAMTNVDIVDRFGDVEARDITCNLSVSNQNGDVVVNNITGNADLLTTFGNVEAKNITGTLDVRDQNGEVTVDKVGGAANLLTRFGSIDVSGVGGSLKVTDNNGEVTARDIAGDTTINTTFGNVVISNIGGSLDIKDNNGKVEIEDAKGNVQVKNSFGDIELASSVINNANISAKTTFGDIDCDNVPLTISESGQQAKAEGKIGEGQYRIDLTTNNGNIQIR